MLKLVFGLFLILFSAHAHAQFENMFAQGPGQATFLQLGQHFSGGGEGGIAVGIKAGVEKVLPSVVGVQVSSLENGIGGKSTYSQSKAYGESFPSLLDPQGKVVMNGRVAGCHGFQDMGSGTIGCENSAGVDPLTLKGINESKGFVTTQDLASKRIWSSDEIADSVDIDLCKPSLNKIDSKKRSRTSMIQKMSLNTSATKIKIGDQEIEIEAVKSGEHITTCRVKGLSQKLEDCYAVFLNRDGKTLECRSQQGPRKVELKTTQDERREAFESVYGAYLDSGKNLSGENFVKLWKEKMQFRPNIEDVYNRSKGSAASSGGSPSRAEATR